MADSPGRARVRWLGAAAGASAVLAGAASAAAGLGGWPVTVGLGAFAGAVAFVGPVLWERREAGAGLAAEWAGVVDAGPAADGAAVSDSVLGSLNPDVRVVRHNLLRRPALRGLVDWCESGEGRVAVVEAGAGQGKTRLLVEACRLLLDDDEERWLCGWVRRGQESGVVEVAGRWGRAVLLVVDDADTRPHLAELLVAAVHGSAGVRVVLAARGFGEWWARLREGAEPEVAAVLTGARRVVLDGLASSGVEQGQLFGQAVSAFARYRGMPRPAVRLAPVPVGTPLVFVHAAAAVAVGEGMSGTVDLDSALERLFDREEAWWRTRLPDELAGSEALLVRRVVVAAVLLGADDLDDAVDVLAHLPGLNSTGPGTAVLRREFAVWLRGLYPQAAGGWIAPHLPARLVERYVAARLAADGPLRAAVAAAAARGGP